MIREALEAQAANPQPWPLTARDRRFLRRAPTLRTAKGEISVEIPGDTREEEAPPAVATPGERESTRIQATLARIGATMGFRIWVPRNDRARVLAQLDDALHGAFLEALPLNYNDATLQTIENIDVLWLNGRAMARAFEVEHTTAIYSGLLRMADLLALQPNIDIRLHIVAPAERRDRVLAEIRRPAFTALDRRPLRESCSFLDYDAVREIAGLPHLRHLNDQVIAEYEVRADDD